MNAESSPESDWQIPPHKPIYSIDMLLLNIIILLIAMGLNSIVSSSAHVEDILKGNPSHYLMKQFIGVLLGSGVLFFSTYKLNIYKLPHLVLLLLGVTMVLLAATHWPWIGVTSKGSSRWINLRFVVFQPSELAKPILVLFLASTLGHPLYTRLSLLRRFCLFIPVFAVLGLIFSEPDLGTTIVVAGSVLIMYFAAGLHWAMVVVLISLGGGLFFILSWITPYQQARITSWLNPWSDPQGKGYHLIQSLIAIGSGGVVGNGLGQSVQKLFYLPEQHTDFIFAVISEEFGFLGATFLIVLFIALAYRGVRIAILAPTPYLKLLAIGLTCMTTMQAWVNMAVVSGSIPTTGLTLPFISFGSSSMIVNMMAMGLLLNISRYVTTKKTPARGSRGAR